MTDDRYGSSGDGKQPPRDMPPAAAAPPPLAAAPPPAAAEPPPIAPTPVAGPSVQPARPFLSPAVIIALLLALVLIVLAVLWFTGVLDRSPKQAETPAVTAPAAPAPSAGGEDVSGSAPAVDPLCDNVRNARDVEGSPPRDGEQRNTVTVTGAGTYLWNGAEVDATRLRQYLDFVSSMSPTPVTLVRVEPGAPPAAVDALQGTISRSLRCTFRPS